MKFTLAVTLLPALAAAAAVGSHQPVQRDAPTANNAAGNVEFGGLIPGSIIKFPGGNGGITATYVGDQKDTHAALFQFADDGKVYKLKADRGEVVTAKAQGWRGWFQRYSPLKVDSNGLCRGCEAPKGKAEAPAPAEGEEKRQMMTNTTQPGATTTTPTPGLIPGLLQLVGGILGTAVSIVVGAVGLVVRLVVGILAGFPTTSTVSVGGTGATVGQNGFLNFPSLDVLGLGASNGIGGVLAGTLQGTQLFQYPDGNVYPMNIARDSAVEGVTVAKNEAGHPVCSGCEDPYPNVTVKVPEVA